MNKAGRIAVTALTGTTLMTADSYLMSLFFGENFREPEHLETMIGRLAPDLSVHAKRIAGWGAHYAMGFVFAAVYVELWDSGKVKHNFRNALILGLVSGILGFLIWKGTFRVHPLPPWMNFDHYYLQRIPAHMVFAVFATIAYRLCPPAKLEKRNACE
jgi:hypothetical protein